MAHMWGTEENLWESVLSFLHVGSKNRSRVFRLGSKRLYPLSHLSSPLFILNLLRANLFLPVCHTLRLKTQCVSKCHRKCVRKSGHTIFVSLPSPPACSHLRTCDSRTGQSSAGFLREAEVGHVLDLNMVISLSWLEHDFWKSLEIRVLRGHAGGCSLVCSP